MKHTPRWFDDPQVILEETKLVDRFVDIVRMDTQADEANDACPSTPGQLDLAKHLAGWLEELGAIDIEVDEHSYVYATFPGRVEGPAVGFIAHLDTAGGFSGRDVKPRFHPDYDGGPIRLDHDVVIDPEDSEPLSRCVGHTIITSDGTTLLGADDKAGVAEILAALQVLRAHPEIPCPAVKIGFTPDEEIGRGADLFRIDRFGALAAYTIDGGFIGEVNSETFSADKATVTIEGVSVHPGDAKGKMVNAMDWAAAFLTRLPPEETPQATEGREGFYHPTEMAGNAASMVVHLILRDFSDDRLAERGRRLEQWVEQLRREEPRLRIDCRIRSQYRNMRSILDRDPPILQAAMTAIAKAGLDIQHKPVRGGTDGSRLTAMGLPTPNLFTGGNNYHGPQEWISTTAMGYATCVILNLIQLWAQPRSSQVG